MRILVLNTATSISQIVFLEDAKMLAEKSWESNQNESEKLLPELQNLIEESGLNYKDLDKICVIQGPGPFTALRVSISVANALAYGLSLPIIGVPAIDYWQSRFNGEVVLYAGNMRVFYQNELINFEDFLSKIESKKKYSGDLRPEQIKQIIDKGGIWVKENNLSSLGETFTKIDLEKYKESSIVKPLYYAPPNITKSNKLYK
jgi:tRNA threonylcarbamoyl adenosine modification protein YeaZ